MNSIQIIFSLIIIGLSFLCFWLPYKEGKKLTGIILGIFLGVIVTWTIIAELEFLVIFIWPFILAFQITFLSYWIFRVFKKVKTGIYISTILSIGFILLFMSPWISDWIFSKNDTRNLFAKHNLELKDDFKILKNTSGGFMDYYHILEIELSNRDYNLLKKEIIESRNYLGNLGNDWYSKRPELVKLDTMNYETKYNYIRDFSTKQKFEDGTFHFVFELSKSENKLKYIGSNE
jgi:hypothetical protein